MEFHNVSSLLWVRQKIKRYEEMGNPKNRWAWRDYWNVDTMPVVLVLYRQENTLRHYQDELAGRQTFCTYAGFALENAWAGKLDFTVITKAGKGG